MGGRAASAANMWELAGSPGTTTGLIEVEAAKCAGASSCTAGWVSNWAVRLARDDLQTVEQLPEM